MLFVFSHRIRLIAARWILSSDIKLDNLPLLFTKMADFLEQEPASNFGFTEVAELEKKVPLDMGKESEQRFNAALKDFPDVLASGHAGQPFANVLYYLGQALLRIPMIIQAISLLSDRHHLKIKDLEEQSKPLFEIWGGESKMSAHWLFQRYSGESNETAIKDLTERLRKSASIAADKLIPIMH